jgi:hypothetical protein
MPDGLQRPKMPCMRDSPVGLADVALPTLGALGGFALTEAHDWPGDEWTGMVIASEASQGPQSIKVVCFLGTGMGCAVCCMQVMLYNL